MLPRWTNNCSQIKKVARSTNRLRSSSRKTQGTYCNCDTHCLTNQTLRPDSSCWILIRSHRSGTSRQFGVERRRSTKNRKQWSTTFSALLLCLSTAQYTRGWWWGDKSWGRRWWWSWEGSCRTETVKSQDFFSTGAMAGTRRTKANIRLGRTRTRSQAMSSGKTKTQLWPVLWFLRPESQKMKQWSVTTMTTLERRRATPANHLQERSQQAWLQWPWLHPCSALFFFSPLPRDKPILHQNHVLSLMYLYLKETHHCLQINLCSLVQISLL